MNNRFRLAHRAILLPALTAVLLFAVSAPVSLVGCAGRSAAGMSPRQVLETSVDNLLSLESYRYSGTSTMTVKGDARLDSRSRFEVFLRLNAEGALDGHMIVTSDEPGGSYETYSRGGTEYTSIEGGEWRSVEKGPPGKGYGMVSATARGIIAEFSDLAEDVRFSGQTQDSYLVSLTMGEKYRLGAAAVAGLEGTAGGGEPEKGSGGSRSKTEMTLTVSRRSLMITGVVMRDSTADLPVAGSVTVVTRGRYSMFDKPVDVEPPPEALAARK